MQRIALATALVVLLIPATAIALDREPAGGGTDRPLNLGLERAGGALEKAEKFKAGTAERGVRGKLNRLIRAHNSLVDSHNELVANFNTLLAAYNSTAANINNCFRTTNVTQYGGYDYEGAIGAETALDFTEPGDIPSARMMIFSC